jgi:benzodiazapine receptor
MKNFIKYFIIGLLINFGGLAIGGLWTNPGTTSEWYSNLNIAPWTPPGWVFAFAWTTIGLTFSMWYGWIMSIVKPINPELIAMYVFSVVLNVIWNPLFFQLHKLGLSWMIITMLWITIYWITDTTRKELGWKPMLLVLPYFIWLCIADSLNLYALLMN